MNPVAEDAWRLYVRGDNREAHRLAKAHLAPAFRAGDTRSAAEFDLVLGLVATDELDLPLAERHLDRAVANLTKVFGPRDLTTLHARAERIVLYREQRRFGDIQTELAALRELAPPIARPMRRPLADVHTVIAIHEDEKGEGVRRLEAVLEHMDDEVPLEDRATVCLHLGTGRHDAGDVQGAVEALRRCLALRMETLGEENRRVADAKVALAPHLLTLGDIDEAGRLAGSALDTLTRLGLERVRRSSSAWAAVGLTHLFANRADEATKHVERAAAIEEKTSGASSVTTARYLAMLGVLHGTRGNEAKAAALLGRALPVLVDLDDEVSEMQVESYLAALTKTGRHREASDWAKHQLAQRRARLSLAVITSLEWAIAQGLLLDGRVAQAEAPLQRTIAAAREAFGPESARVAEFEHHLEMVRSGARPVRRSFA